MKTYAEYKEEALEILRAEHGNNTVEFVTQIRSNLHLVTQSVIMLDLMTKLEEQKNTTPVTEEVKEVKTPRTTTKK